MGNKNSLPSVSYPIPSFQMMTMTNCQHDPNEEDEKETVFNIFHVAKKEDAGIISQPLTKITTSDFCVDFQIAYSFCQEKNTREDKDIEDVVYVKEFKRDDDEIFIASVLDGHQGMDACDYVCSHLFSTLANKLFENPENIEMEIKSIFQNIDTAYCTKKAEGIKLLTKKSKKSCSCLGKSSVESHASYYIGSGCVLIGLGDCGIVCSIAGRASYSLLRHNPSHPLESQRIFLANGRVINGRVDDMLAVSRSIGDVYFKRSYRQKKANRFPQTDVVIAEPEVEIYPVSHNLEFCIIGSDGLFSQISYQSAVNTVKDFISKGRSGEEVCKELINRARHKTKDDISIIILFFHITNHEKTHTGLFDDDTIDVTRALSDADDDTITERTATYQLSRSLSDKLAMYMAMPSYSQQENKQ